MDIKDIKTPKNYDKNGEKKTVWLNVGCLKTTDAGKQFIELNMFPGQNFCVFERVEKVTHEQPTSMESSGQGLPF